jgi:hypothetical protein
VVYLRIFFEDSVTFYELVCQLDAKPSPALVPLASDAGSRVLLASWRQRSEASKNALRVLLKMGTASLEAGGMRDELESSRLAFVPADHSDSCNTVILNSNSRS